MYNHSSFVNVASNYTSEDYERADLSIPVPMTQEQVRQMRLLVPREAYEGAHSKSIDLCAMYVRQAIERSHRKITGKTLNMKQKPTADVYGESLIRSGYRVVSEPIQIGDIVIFNKTSASPWGHIQVFDGENWISDYRQRTMYPDHRFKSMVPVIYRFYGIQH